MKYAYEPGDCVINHRDHDARWQIIAVFSKGRSAFGDEAAYILERVDSGVRVLVGEYEIVAFVTSRAWSIVRRSEYERRRDLIDARHK